MDISVDEFRGRMQRMEDFSFTASTGAKVTMDLSALRAMSEEERRAARARFDVLAAKLRNKYAHAAAAAQT